MKPMNQSEYAAWVAAGCPRIKDRWYTTPLAALVVISAVIGALVLALVILWSITNFVLLANEGSVRALWFILPVISVIGIGKGGLRLLNKLLD